MAGETIITKREQRGDRRTWAEDYVIWQRNRAAFSIEAKGK